VKGEKTISRVDGNIKNNLVKFADNLSFSYFKAPQKQQRFDEEYEANQQRNEKEI